MSEIYVTNRGQLRHELSQIVETFGYEAVFNELLYGDFRKRYSLSDLHSLGLSTRALYGLLRNGIQSVEQLRDVIEHDPDSLLRFRQFGRGLLNEVIQKASTQQEAGGDARQS